MVSDAYKDAGVDIEANERANERAKELVRQTHDQNVVSDLEGLFSTGYRFDRQNGELFGQCLVTINNRRELERNIGEAIEHIHATGGHPLFMTDYVAFGKLLDIKTAEVIAKIASVAERPDGTPLSLIGGEIAEMPGVIRKGTGEIVVAITYQAQGASDLPSKVISLKDFPGDILTTSIDSVGTKTKLGLQVGLMQGLYGDMVGHSVGDIIVGGGSPLGVAMYTGHSPALEHEFRPSYDWAVTEAGLADMGFVTHARNVYCKGQFDIVGSVLGIVDEARLRSGRNIEASDHLVGWKSSGVNTNGYSLIRKLVDTGAIDPHEEIPGTQMSAGRALMMSHENYEQAVKLIEGRFGDALKGIAHITGGGIRGNVSRLIPDGLDISIESLPDNPVFRYIQERGDIPMEDMLETFNMGVGLVSVVDKKFDVGRLPASYHVVGQVVKA